MVVLQMAAGDWWVTTVLASAVAKVVSMEVVAEVACVAAQAG